jgi:hypothetical protein
MTVLTWRLCKCLYEWGVEINVGAVGTQGRWGQRIAEGLLLSRTSQHGIDMILIVYSYSLLDVWSKDDSRCLNGALFLCRSSTLCVMPALLCNFTLAFVHMHAEMHHESRSGNQKIVYMCLMQKAVCCFCITSLEPRHVLHKIE